MKPISGGSDCDCRRDRNFCRCRFPITDCNFQTFSRDRYHGDSAGSSPASFLNISREYFRHEARRNFVVEIVFFLVITAILTVTFISDARAIIQFLHLPAA